MFLISLVCAAGQWFHLENAQKLHLTQSNICYWRDEKYFSHINVVFELHTVVFNTTITYVNWLTVKDLLKFYNLHWCKTLFSLRQQVTCPPYGIQILSFHMMESSYHCNTQEQIYIIHILSNMVNIKQRCWVSSNPYCFIY